MYKNIYIYIAARAFFKIVYNSIPGIEFRSFVEPYGWRVQSCALQKASLVSKRLLTL